MSIKWVSEFTVPNVEDGVRFEDDGVAAVMYFTVEDDPNEIGGDGHFFVRLHSWDNREYISEKDKHQLFRRFMGRRVRVTLETIDESQKSNAQPAQPDPGEDES